MTRTPRSSPSSCPGWSRATVRPRRRRRGPPAPARPPRPPSRPPTRSRASWSTCRWPTWTGRSTTRCPPRWPRPPCRAPGSRCASPARTSTGTSSPAPPPPSTPLPTCAGSSAPSPFSPRDRGAHRRRGPALRRHPLGRAAPRGPRPARHRREGPRPRARTAPFDAGAAAEAWHDHEPGEAFLRHLADGGARAPSGARRPAPTGRTCSPTPPPRRTPAVAARCSASPTARTSPASTARSRRCWATATTSR